MVHRFRSSAKKRFRQIGTQARAAGSGITRHIAKLKGGRVEIKNVRVPMPFDEGTLKDYLDNILSPYDDDSCIKALAGYNGPDKEMCEEGGVVFDDDLPVFGQGLQDILKNCFVKKYGDAGKDNIESFKKDFTEYVEKNKVNLALKGA